MSTKPQKYCLDSNVLIEAWQKYYSPKFCPSYWDVLNKLGAEEIIFIPETVFEEITRTDDELASWLKESTIPIHNINENVNVCLQSIYAKDPLHKYLVDNIKLRSLADPWIIAHALSAKATVVTKENKETALNTKRIKIPNVCDNMGVRWVNDFDFVKELNLFFSCKIK